MGVNLDPSHWGTHISVGIKVLRKIFEPKREEGPG
jgi:hypothetical protein